MLEVIRMLCKFLLFFSVIWNSNNTCSVSSVLHNAETFKAIFKCLIWHLICIQLLLALVLQMSTVVHRNLWHSDNISFHPMEGNQLDDITGAELTWITVIVDIVHCSASSVADSQWPWFEYYSRNHEEDLQLDH